MMTKEEITKAVNDAIERESEAMAESIAASPEEEDLIVRAMNTGAVLAIEIMTKALVEESQVLSGRVRG